MLEPHIIRLGNNFIDLMPFTERLSAVLQYRIKFKTAAISIINSVTTSQTKFSFIKSFCDLNNQATLHLQTPEMGYSRCDANVFLKSIEKIPSAQSLTLAMKEYKKKSDPLTLIDLGRGVFDLKLVGEDLITLVAYNSNMPAIAAVITFFPENLAQQEQARIINTHLDNRNLIDCTIFKKELVPIKPQNYLHNLLCNI